MSNALDDRRKALEESFFAKHEAKLIEELRHKREHAEAREGLERASGISNSELLDRLVDLGISAQTVAALSLVPLVAVAWADGSVDPKERTAVLAAAAEVGLRAGHVGHGLLEGWLGSAPGPELMRAWREYIGELTGALSASECTALRDDLLGRARKVAEATGGFLGMGNKVSTTEAAVLDQLEAAFS